jgi:phenylacetic acid degradation operon negative regulatory protein
LNLSPFPRKADRSLSGHKPPPGLGPVEKFGVLQPQETILQLFGEYVDLQERAWSGGLVQLLGELGFSGPASRVALNRVISRGLLMPIKEGRFVFYRITPRLRVVHEEGRKQTYSAVADPAWGGEWTIVCYNAPEEHSVKRARLGRWLHMRGFGLLQEGTWVCAGDSEAEIMELAARLGLEKHLVVLVGALSNKIDARTLVERSWRIQDLKKMYNIFVREFAGYRNQLNSAGPPARDAFVLRTRLIEMFRQIVTLDPRLPDSVLQVQWRRKEAVELFRELQERLRLPAAEHFRNVAVTG